MKKLLLFLLVVIPFAYNSFGQVPDGISYQAIARNNEGQPLVNKSIKLKLTLIKNNISGEVEYIELHSLTTNAFGLFTTIIGKGTPTQGAFNTIDWSNCQRFLKVEVDLNNSNQFELQGTSQLLSVPYSFFSAKAAHVDSAKYSTLSAKSQLAEKAIESDTASYAKKTALTAGFGIEISDNKIINILPSQWNKADGNLNYTNGTVTVGTDEPYIGNLGAYKFTVRGGSSSLGDETVMITSDSPWETQLGITNSVSNAGFFFNVTGPVNSTGSGNFNIVRSKKGSTYPFTISSMDYVGIGKTNPTSKLEVNGDIELSEATNGIIMKSPNGNCFRVTIDDAGNFVRTQIVCP
jgi:hypothetical protein